MLRHGSMTRIDRYTTAALTSENLSRCVFVLATVASETHSLPSRWIDFRCAALGGVFLSGLAAVLVYGGTTLPGASDAGFALAQATGFSALTMFVVRLLNMFQVSANR